MPIFTQSLKKVDTQNPAEALKDMANHIRYIQEQLEWTLMNLDSSNITEIETDKTNITSSTGGTQLTGDRISLTGKNGEQFTAGIDASGNFAFTVKGKNGEQMLYLSDGKLTITKNSNLSIDCGEW